MSTFNICNETEVIPGALAGVDFIKIALNYYAWCPIFRLLSLVKKISPESFFGAQAQESGLNKEMKGGNRMKVINTKIC